MVEEKFEFTNLEWYEKFQEIFRTLDKKEKNQRDSRPFQVSPGQKKKFRTFQDIPGQWSPYRVLGAWHRNSNKQSRGAKVCFQTFYPWFRNLHSFNTKIYRQKIDISCRLIYHCYRTTCLFLCYTAERNLNNKIFTSNTINMEIMGTKPTVGLWKTIKRLSREKSLTLKERAPLRHRKNASYHFGKISPLFWKSTQANQVR